MSETGSEATVGIESVDGADAVQHSFNAPMSVSTALAYDFTPGP